MTYGSVMASPGVCIGNDAIISAGSLPLAAAWHAAVVVIVFQSLVELFGMVTDLSWVPNKLIPEPSST
ncbi:hypothetical protein [Halomonas sp. 11-S5]|uniref:hypothetical protein n=1 Tax=Halomonas sp. 11-S5 TaxID=2994064 RepID=UPI0032AF0DC0